MKHKFIIYLFENKTNKVFFLDVNKTYKQIKKNPTSTKKKLEIQKHKENQNKKPN